MASAANAGTYSIVDVEWVVPTAPGSGTGGGYCNFGTGSSSLDVLYGINPSIATVFAPTATGNSFNLSPTVLGYWRWKIQWVGAVGEAAPYYVSGVMEVGGSSTVTVGASWFSGSTNGDGQGELNDPYFLTALQHAVADSGTPMDFPTPATVSGPFFETVGTGAFTLVSGTTYVGYVYSDVNDIGYISASGYGTVTYVKGIPIVGVAASGGASISLAATLRLLSIDGQTLQSNL